MPKTRIVEKDNTSLGTESAISNIVYVPVALTAESESSLEPVLCKTFEDLDAIELVDETHISYKLAKHLIRLGMYVLVEGIAPTVNNGEDEEDTTSYVIPDDSFTRLKDKGLYDIRFITTGGMGRLLPKAFECAKDRGDCVYLTSVEKQETVTAVREAVRTALFAGKTEAECVTTYGEIQDYSYTSIFYPDFTTSHEDFGKDVEIPAEYGFLFAYAVACQTYPEWYAAAGSFRGIISELKDVVVKLTTADVEILQSRACSGEVELDKPGDNLGFAINPISWVRPFGYIVWGNRTLYITKPVNNEVSLKASAFLNIRNLANSIKKVLYEASNKFKFEQNTESLWINFKNEVTPTLNKMETGNGISGYKFYKVPVNKKARLKCILHIIPIEAVEDFDIELIFEDSLETIVSE